MAKDFDFDAVVIGSGFGGSVMTYRLAEADMEVCLLERGKPYPPNSFPRTPDKMAKNFWDPSKGLYGLFNVWSFKGSGALVSSGLGGGSLIYANVLKRKDGKWFSEGLPNEPSKPWVVQYPQLERHYEEVEAMLDAQKYPIDSEAYKNTFKTLAMKEAPEKIKKEYDDKDLQCEWELLNLAVSFRSKNIAEFGEDNVKNPPVIGAEIKEKFENIHSVRAEYKMPRSTCRLCGECDIGCNYGSKNTLDFNYISAAIHKNKNTEVSTLSEVKSFERIEGGFRVDYLIHEPEKYDIDSGKKFYQEKSITCKYLIVSAGTFGTQYLLSKNIQNTPNISETLGSRYTVNGDLLSFILKSFEDKNGKSVPRRLDPTVGPVITSALRFGDDLDGNGTMGRGFYVEDGGHPAMLSWAGEVSGLGGYLIRLKKFLKLILKYRFGLSYDSDLGAEISDLIGDATSAMSSMPMLTMGRDVPSGNLSLTKDERLACDWTIKHSADYFKRVRRAGKAFAKTLGAEFMDNPSYRWNFHQVLTAHPIGGCGMGNDKTDGVVNSCGEVFGEKNLYIADGSVMPGPVGPNPSLTIAALSNRFAEHIIADHKGENHECSDDTK